MIEVLWIDDECLTSSKEYTPMGREFIEYAYNYDILITPMSSYKEGIEALKNNPLKWCVVILDIYNEKTTSESPSDDFKNAADEIIRIQERNHHLEPYTFILSGNKQYHTNNILLTKPDYASKRVYDKNNGDYAILFEDILKIKKISPLYHCWKEFSDVLTAAKDFCGDETEKRIRRILDKIIVQDIKNDASLFNEIRKALEDIMKGLKVHNYSFFSSDIEKESLNNLSRYIGKDETVPEYIQRAFHTLDRITQPGSHNTIIDTDISNSPYLLRSCLYELCNILIWAGSLN